MSVRTRKYIKRLSAQFSPEEIRDYFANSVFIVSAPRSGSTLLYTLLSHSPDVWTIRGESHGIYAQFPHLSGENERLDSGQLDATHADETTARQMRVLYLALLKNIDDHSFYDKIQTGTARNIVFLEKTPRNSLNIKFLTAVFPKARFIFLNRDPRENISSLIEGWETGARTGQFVTFRNLPEWPLGHWCFILPPGWQSMRDKSLAEIAAFQWRACNEIILDDLSRMAEDQWLSVSYSDLISDPRTQLSRLCEFCHAEMGTYLQDRSTDNLALSSSTITPPKKDKWKRHEHEIRRELPGLQQIIERLGALY